MTRVLTALVLVPVITYAVLWAPAALFTVVLYAIGVFAFREFASIAGAHGMPVNPWIGFLAGASLLVLRPELVLACATLAAMTLAMREQDLKRSLPAAAALVLGLLYVFGAWRCAVELRRLDPWLLFFALAINWAGDTAAMYVGKTFGSHKMSPVVSPGKTWEGAIASSVASLVLGLALFRYVRPGIPWWTIVALSLAGNAAGQIGDLAESALKRGAGMKDSGHSLPGHGGWLDRIDSSLFSMPTVYALSQMLPL